MDELEIDGKKYFSSRRAAKEHKYHIDYIGQLIRAGKVAGRKVGRSWYVEARSLKDYLDQESGKAQEPMPAPIPPAQPQPEVPQPTTETEPEVGGESARPMPQESPAHSAPIMHLHKAPIVKETVQEKKFEPTQYAASVEHKVYFSAPEAEAPRQTLTYVEDNEPMLPVLNGRANADFISVPLHRIATRSATEPLDEEDTKEEEGIIEENSEVRESRRASKPRALMLASVALVALILTAAGSALLATSIKVEEGQPASVGITLK